MKPVIIINTLAFLSLLVPVGLTGQVCNGSLGDPVVNVDFGSGINPGAPLQSATTTYNFTASTCPDDGSYTVVNSTAGCFGNSWHTIAEDHTPNDANGYMMLVNASFNPGDFYVDTVKGLCANTTYEFAAWVMNVLLSTSCTPIPILPKLIFNIETAGGTILGTYSTGDVGSTANPSWTQYGLFFKTPPNTNTVVIRITNTAPGGCGNDLALDDITFRPCGPTVKVSGNNNQAVFDQCSGATSVISLNAHVGVGYTLPSVQWQESLDKGITWADIPGQTTTNYTFNKTAIGVYLYRLVVAEGSNISISTCRVASNIVTITIHDKPVITASVNSPVCEGNLVNFLAAGGKTYRWTGPGGFTSSIADPRLMAATNLAGVYTVMGTDQFGCTNTAATSVVVNPRPAATITNDKNICEGDSVALIASGGISYQWSPATGLSDPAISNPIAKPAITTVYQVVVTGTNTCTDTAQMTIIVLSQPIANAGTDKVLLKGQSAMLDGSITGNNITYFWTPPVFLDNAALLKPVTTPLKDQLYTLHAVSNQGCGGSTDDVFVKVYNDIYIPKAFSPNNDGLNDTWRIEALAVYPNAIISVFDRYGQKVFEGSGSNMAWDGLYKNKELPIGAYAYLVDLKTDRPILKGMVMIVR